MNSLWHDVHPNEVEPGDKVKLVHIKPDGGESLRVYEVEKVVGHKWICGVAHLIKFGRLAWSSCVVGPLPPATRYPSRTQSCSSRISAASSLKISPSRSKGASVALDQITQALVNEFLTDATMVSNGAERDFEKFSAYVLVSPHIEGAVDYHHVITGSGGDTGLDAIALIVNGELVTDSDEVDELADAGATLDVHYIFIQTETATSFSTAKIGQIAYGVQDFFADSPTLARTS